MKIAVIDEDVIVRDFIVSTLMYSVNREILTFDNGFDAWISFEESGFPDLIIADVNLQKIDSFALMPKVKETSPKTIVVLFSDLPSNETTAKEQGVDAFLAKPFGVNELFSLVQTFVVEQDPAGDPSTPA
ncbi:MAG: response regulator [Desulfobacterales bacterium]|nr:response regulator [Desulfobacterales bacterium]MDX2512796.1 response regulator [Desulfobacterales bacterium]